MLQFNDTATYRGLVQVYEKETGAPVGYISGDATRLKQYTADANLALDDFTAIAIQASGSWQWDDSNHPKYPEIQADLVQGQRDYTFTADEQGNLILDIYRVFVKDAGGVYRMMTPVDQQSETAVSNFWDGRDTPGTPQLYDKTANGIILDVPPSYSWRLANEGSRGLKVMINREGSHFVHGDTTKMPGIPGIFHRYLVLRPAEDYARRNALKNYPAIHAERIHMEAAIAKYFSRREKDVRRRIIASRVRSV